MDAIEYFKGMRKRLCEDHLKLLPQKSIGYQATIREMSFYDAAIEALEQSPLAQLEIVRCSQCKYAEVADSEDSQDGYTCQFHRRSIWFSGSYCSWAERKGRSIKLQEMTREEGPDTATKATASKDRCMYCKEMFDLYCAKSKKFVIYEEFHRFPYKPKWCKGRTPTNEYHD